MKAVWGFIKYVLAVPFALYVIFPNLYKACDRADTELFPFAGMLVYLLFVVGAFAIIRMIKDAWEMEL